jgi:hypothetical protein
MFSQQLAKLSKQLDHTLSKTLPMLCLILALLILIFSISLFVMGHISIGVGFLICSILFGWMGTLLLLQQRKMQELYQINPHYRYYQEAFATLEKQGPQKAIPYFEKITEQFSSGLDLAYANLTQAYLQLDNEEKGMYYYQKGYENGSSCRVKVLQVLADYYQQKGDEREKKIREEYEELQALIDLADLDATTINEEDTLFPVPKPGPQQVVNLLTDEPLITSIYVVQKSFAQLPDRISQYLILVSDAKEIPSEEELNQFHMRCLNVINETFPFEELDVQLKLITLFTHQSKDQALLNKIKLISPTPYFDRTATN